MTRIRFISPMLLSVLAAGASLAQTTPAPPGPLVPGTPAPLVSGVVQGQPYTVGEFQSTNPNYPIPNPFYFEGRVDWDKLNITNPANTWEYAQRGMHNQDDLGNLTAALQDYETSYQMNNLANGTCQIVTAATLVNGALPSTLNPPPCMFTVRLRMAHLLTPTQPDQAISLYQEVLAIDPLRLDINALIGEVYLQEAQAATDPTTQMTAYQNAIQAFKAELVLSPVTPQFTALTGDLANNAHVHWSLAEVYEALGQSSNQMSELNLYLQATQWHSDVYPWRITIAKTKIATLTAAGVQPAAANQSGRKSVEPQQRERKNQ